MFRAWLKFQMKENQSFVLTLANVPRASAQPIIAVLVPWGHFQHKLGPTAYSSLLSRADGTPIVVSLDPNGKWWSDTGGLDEMWANICKENPPHKLQWREVQFEGEPPWIHLK